MKLETLLCSVAFSLVCACATLAADKDYQDQEIQTIKQQALELNRDLLILEEERLFPEDSRLTVFLSVDSRDFRSLDTVTLSIDGNRVTDLQYTQEQLDALRHGGAHQLYMGNMQNGNHQIVAVFAGRGTEDRAYQGRTELTLEKTSGARSLELKIINSKDLQEPEFSVVEAVEPLRYRTALFYYFQQDYFNALTELMTAQQLDESGALLDNAELLRGGASLSYGMDLAAQQIFEKLLVEPGASPDRDRAWFYLGKLAWQRGALVRSAQALDRMAPTYHGQLAPEANFLRASISMRQGNEQLAASYDTLLPADSPWLYYLYYNLGASHAAGRDWSAAVDYFERVVDSPLSTPEIRSLRDKALTASGYAYLAAENYEQAALSFSRVRLDSPLVDHALLGYGWAYCGAGDFRSAVTPWQALAERSLMSDSVRESLLALAYAHEQLGRLRTALEQYRHAGELYASELAKVQAAMEALRAGDLSQQLDLAGDGSQDWLNAQDISFQDDQLPYLRHLMTRHDFQIAMRELRDLQSMARYLSGAGQRLQVLSQEGRLPDYDSRIRALQERLDSKGLQLQASLLDAGSRVRALAVTELDQQAVKLRQALGQSRLAVARMYENSRPEALR